MQRCYRESYVHANITHFSAGSAHMFLQGFHITTDSYRTTWLDIFGVNKPLLCTKSILQVDAKQGKDIWAPISLFINWILINLFCKCLAWSVSQNKELAGELLTDFGDIPELQQFHFLRRNFYSTCAWSLLCPLRYLLFCLCNNYKNMQA